MGVDGSASGVPVPDRGPGPGRRSAPPGAAARLHRLLESAGATVASAESLTGGRLAALLTATPGASRSYLGGVVSYATSVKTDLLGVPPELIRAHGAVSAECALAMADRIRAVTGADYGLSTTGVAGPEPQDGRPPGLVFVGVAGPAVHRAAELRLLGDRGEVQERACRDAVELLLVIVDPGGTSGADSDRAVSDGAVSDGPDLAGEETGLR